MILIKLKKLVKLRYKQIKIKQLVSDNIQFVNLYIKISLTDFSHF